MKHAFTMIELVISIVVMGIVVMSLPLILTQTEQSNLYAIQQEAILSTKSRIGEILTYDWDENSYNLTNNRAFVLNTASTNADFNRVGTTTRRKGHTDIAGRRRLSEVATPQTASAIGNDGTINDIDDFNGDSISLNPTVGSPGDLDYVFSDINLTTSISYEDDGNTIVNSIHEFDPNSNPVGTTNIKMIEVNATATGLISPIVLRAFSCNIGDVAPLKSRPFR